MGTSTTKLSQPRHMGKHVHKPWNSCHSVRLCEKNWVNREKYTYQQAFDTHRPLKTAFYNPPWHPEWAVSTLGNKLTTKTTDEFRQFAQASSWEMHKPTNRGSAPWRRENNVYPRAMYVTCPGMSSSFLQ